MANRLCYATPGAVGLVISAIVDHSHAGQRLKEAVSNGLDAWTGVWDNMGTIARALPGYVGATVARPVVAAVQESVVQPIMQAAQAVSDAVRDAAASVDDAVSRFIGRVFGRSG